jgi:hypothetical protein
MLLKFWSVFFTVYKLKSLIFFSFFHIHIFGLILSDTFGYQIYLQIPLDPFELTFEQLSITFDHRQPAR